MTMITSVFLDLDDTLLDFTKGEALALRQALEAVGITPTAEILSRYHTINAQFWRMLEEQKVTRAQVVTGRFDQLFAELGITCSAEQIWKLYEAALSRQHDFLPGAEALLSTLYSRYSLYLASNGTASVQRQRLKDSGISKWFQGIFISQEIGADKPSPLFFQRCFASIPGFSRENAIIVGDSLTSDIRGGIAAGIHTCWFNPQRKPPRPDICPDWEIHDLSQLPSLLEQL